MSTRTLLALLTVCTTLALAHEAASSQPDFTFEWSGRAAPTTTEVKQRTSSKKTPAASAMTVTSRRNRRLAARIERLELQARYNELRPPRQKTFVRETGFLWANMASAELYCNVVNYANIEMPIMSLQFGYHRMFSPLWGGNAGLGFCLNTSGREFSTDGTLFRARDATTSKLKMTAKLGLTRALNQSVGIFGGLGMATEAPWLIYTGILVRFEQLGFTITADIPFPRITEFKIGGGILVTFIPPKKR